MDSQDDVKRTIHLALLELAESAARDAGNLSRELQRRFIDKTRDECESLAKKALSTANDSIRTRIHETFPRHAIVTKGSELEKICEFTWYVDAIDGITNFTHGIPLWGTSISCCLDGKAIIAVIYLPALNECYKASLDGPALCNGHPISVSNTCDPEKAVVLNGDFNTSPDPEIRAHLNQAGLAARELHASTFYRARCLGSPAVESAWVAAGRVDAYVILRCPPWDVAAGTLLVARAGGCVSGIDGSPWTPDVRHALMSNMALHAFLAQSYSPWHRNPDIVPDASAHTRVNLATQDPNS